MNLLEGLEVGVGAAENDLEPASGPDKLAGHEDVAFKNGAQPEAPGCRPRGAGGNAGIALQRLVSDQAEHGHRNIGKLQVEAAGLELAAGQPLDAQISL